jgi:hypothetical protein
LALHVPLVPARCTWAVPDIALDATIATICVSLQLETVPNRVPNHTLLGPRVAPKPDPEIVTGAPAAAVGGDTFETLGGGTTVKGVPALPNPPAATTTLPVVASMHAAAERRHQRDAAAVAKYRADMKIRPRTSAGTGLSYLGH